MIVCFDQFISSVGPYLNTEMWKELVETFCLCFQRSVPVHLMEEVDTFISLQNKKSSDASEDHKQSFKKRISENEFALD
jgi:hypothetical protein